MQARAVDHTSGPQIICGARTALCEECAGAFSAQDRHRRMGVSGHLEAGGAEQQAHKSAAAA